MLPINSLFAQFNELADQLIDEVNATSITVVYNIGTSSGNTTRQLNNSFSQDVHDLMQIPDGTKDLYTVNTSQETLLVRAYWNKGKDSQFPANLRDNMNVCKINCYTTDVHKFNNASYFELDGVKCKMIIPPAPYGFAKRYSILFLEKFGDGN